MALLAGLLGGASALAFVGAVAARSGPPVAALVPAPARQARSPVVPGLTRRLVGVSALRRLARVHALAERLRAAGWDAAIDDVVSTKVAVGLGAGSIVAALAPRLLPLALVVGAGGFLLPDLVVARAARNRVRRADAEVPQFLDLLAASSSAGLAAPAAVSRAVSGVRGPLAEELASAAAAVEIGGRWRDELDGIADRLHLPDLRAAVVAIARTETLGSSLADATRHLAEDVRESRRARAAEAARTAPVKMLFPLVCMILPAFLLLTVVPVLIATLRSLR